MTVGAVVFDIGRVLIEWEPERFYDRTLGEERRRALFEAVPLHAMNERVDLGHPWEEEVASLAAAHLTGLLAAAGAMATDAAARAWLDAAPAYRGRERRTV